MMLAAPTVGTLLQIIKLATSGTVVQGRRRRHRVRSGRGAVQPAAGRIRARGSRTGTRQDAGRREGAGGAGPIEPAARAATTCGAPRSKSAATSSSARIEAEEEHARARGEDPRARAARARHQDASRRQQGGACRDAGEAREVANRGRLRAQEHRQHDRARAAQRPGRHQGEPGRRRRLRLHGHDAARLPRWRHRAARPQRGRDRRPHRDGDQDQDFRDRANVDHLGRAGEGAGRSAAGHPDERRVERRRQSGAEGLLGTAKRRASSMRRLRWPARPRRFGPA